MPPVHPNCRCSIGQDDIWYDAEDARVCPMCMALGASWNARTDTPMSDAEADAALDRAGKKDVKDAIARDQKLADAVIADAAAVAESGVIKEIGTLQIAAGAESLTIRIERKAVQALAEARAKAAVPIGTPVSGFGTTTEGLVFETTGKGKRPVFVSVNIATGKTHRVIRRRGKYLLQTLGGKTISSGDNLALLLLLLAIYEKERRDREAAKEAEARQ